MAMSQATANTHLDAWIAADLATSKGQSYSIAGRSLSRANADEIREQITYWQNIVSQFEAATLGATRTNVMIAVKTR